MFDDFDTQVQIEELLDTFENFFFSLPIERQEEIINEIKIFN